MTRFEEDFAREFKPNTLEEIETIAKAKADAHEGKKPQSEDALYLETYSVEKSFRLIEGAK